MYSAHLLASYLLQYWRSQCLSWFQTRELSQAKLKDKSVKDVIICMQILRVIVSISSYWELHTFYLFWSDSLGENREKPGGGNGLPPPGKNLNRNQFVCLSFGVDPLNREKVDRESVIIRALKNSGSWKHNANCPIFVVKGIRKRNCIVWCNKNECYSKTKTILKEHWEEFHEEGTQY